MPVKMMVKNTYISLPYKIVFGSFLMIFVFLLAQPASAGVCWKRSYGRGVGTIPGSCGEYDKSGLLCYPKCRDNYKGVSFVCWQNCPAGYRDDGAFCAKPAPYGRGAGYPWKFGDGLNDNGMRERCLKDHPEGCEKNGAIFYPVCKPGFHAVGCCICSPDCPSGMTDIGVSCAKDSYVRKTLAPTCGDKQYNAGLCYKTCNAGYTGIGPVCWGRCPPDKPVDCGAMCGTSAGDCANAIIDQIISVGEVVGKIATIVGTLGAGTAATAAEAAAEQSALAGLKALGRDLAKDLAEKFVNMGIDQMKSKVVEELRGQNVPPAIAAQLAQIATEPDNLGIEFLRTIDVLGLENVVNAFNKEICNVVPRTDEPADGC